MKPNLLNDNTHINSLWMHFTALLSFSNCVQEHLVMHKQKDVKMPWELVAHNIFRKYLSPLRVSQCSCENRTCLAIRPLIS